MLKVQIHLYEKEGDLIIRQEKGGTFIGQSISH